VSEANSRVEEEPRYAPRQALLDLPAPLPLPGRIRVALFRGFAFARPRLKLWLRARQEIRCTFCCWPPGPLARRERRAYPLRYVRSEQHSQRACGPQPGGARRRAGICGVAAPRRCHHIACVAAPCICPPGARAKMHTLFSDGPLASHGGHKVHKSVKFCIMAGTAMPRSHRGTGISPVNDRAVRVSA